jgi:hypothetical protein
MNIDELEQALEDIILSDGDDGYYMERKRVRQLAHDHMDGNSSARLASYLTVY